MGANFAKLLRNGNIDLKYRYIAKEGTHVGRPLRITGRPASPDR